MFHLDGTWVASASDLVTAMTCEYQLLARRAEKAGLVAKLDVAEDALQAHPGFIGIFAINDPSALGAVAALEKAGRQDQVTIIGFDGQPEGKQAIKDGKIYADPIQFPDKIARETVRSIIAYLSGEEVPADQPIDSALYRKADAEADPELK